MKNIVYTLGLLAFCSFQKIAAQDNLNQDELEVPQAMSEGEFMVTLFGSYPNFGRYLAQTSLINSDVQNYKTGGTAPIGFQLEYMLSNTFSFTVDGIYNTWNAEWQHNFFGEIFNNNVKEERYRLLFGMNYHFNELENERVNFYAGGAVGMNKRNFTKNVDEYWGSTFWDFYINSPLAFRARTGIRFFINKQWGANLELGLGGPVLRFGLTYRILKLGQTTPKAPDARDKM